MMRTGIDRIVDKFLDDGSRPFNDFSGGDLVDRVLIEDLNFLSF